jgi:hypothetical protein
MGITIVIGILLSPVIILIFMLCNGLIGDVQDDNDRFF